MRIRPRTKVVDEDHIAHHGHECKSNPCHNKHQLYCESVITLNFSSTCVELLDAAANANVVTYKWKFRLFEENDLPQGMPIFSIVGGILKNCSIDMRWRAIVPKWCVTEFIFWLIVSYSIPCIYLIKLIRIQFNEIYL